MVVIDTTVFIHTAVYTVKKRYSASGFQIQPYRPLAASEVGLRGVGPSILVVQFDTVELSDEVIPQPLPAG